MHWLSSVLFLLWHFLSVQGPVAPHFAFLHKFIAVELGSTASVRDLSFGQYDLHITSHCNCSLRADAVKVTKESKVNSYG